MQRLIAIVVAAIAVGCGTPHPGSSPGVLDKQAQLERFDWWDNRDWDWYAKNIPFLETPDAEIDATYYYRWEVLTKHLVYGAPEHGYTFTEFADRPFWSGSYGAISCPLGHQLYEVRWLKDRRIVDDFARYWFDVPGAEPRSYSNWYADALWAIYEVVGDARWIVSMLPYMQRQYAGWMDERWDGEHRMFRWDGMHDGMETTINSRQTPQWFDGAEGYRPTLNAYLYADAVAISRTAELAGDLILARDFAASAAELKTRVQQQLWDPEREFFFQQFAADEETVADPWPGAGNQQFGGPAVAGARVRADGSPPSIVAKTLTYQTGPWAGDPHGREAIGFVPWQFNLPDPGYENAWQSLMDPERFYAPFGPTVTERGDPLYYVSPRCCVWSGNSWPYATTQTLVALANLLNNYEQNAVEAADWFELFRNYALTQRKGGRPYVAEAANPDTGAWSGHDKFFHSEHYLHSGFVDLVITGLIGLRPGDDMFVVNPLAPAEWDWFALDDVAYRGHRVTVLWDRDGSRYGRGRGLQVLVDGEVRASSASLGRLEVVFAELEEPRTMPALGAGRIRNFAVNNQKAWYPHASASSLRPEYPPDWAVDGQYWYHASPPNRWVPDGSLAEDWFEVDFGVEHSIEELRLYFLDDTIRVPDFVAEDAPDRVVRALAQVDGHPVAAPPHDYRVEAWIEGAWAVVEGTREPPTPTGRQANHVRLRAPIRTSRVRVVLEHRPGFLSGLAEFEVWGGGEPSSPTARVPNLAYNPTGSGTPEATASSHAEGPLLAVVNDGEAAFNYYSRKRWTTLGTNNIHDWIEIELSGAQQVHEVGVYFWAWESRGTAAPKTWGAEYWDGGGWAQVPGPATRPSSPMAMALNTVVFEAVVTSRLRIWFEHAAPAATGISEIVIR